MTNVPRTASRLPRERRIADLMRAAREVFAEKGYDAASVSEIAERAGLVEGNIYRHFENKRALLVKVVEDWYEEMLSDYDDHLQGIVGTRNRLRYMIWRHLSTIEKEPALCRLVFGELRSGADYRETTVFQLNREYTQRTIGILKEGMRSGELRSDVPVELARDLIYGCIEHHTWAYLRGEGTFSAAASADAITNVVYAGLSHEKKSTGADALATSVRRLERVAKRLGSKRSDSKKTREHVPQGARRKSR
jgi:AcrR family transcriptional regulator